MSVTKSNEIYSRTESLSTKMIEVKEQKWDKQKITKT
jgi:hypothetical protein